MLNKLPSKYQYNEMIYKLESCLDYYEQSDYMNRHIKLYTASAEALSFSFFKKNIPHLLGVNIFNLRQIRCLSEDKPYEMLRELINKKDYIYKKIEKGEISFFTIFSPYVLEKIDSFVNVINFKPSSIKFLCRYDKSLTYTSGSDENYGCEYYIVLENEDGLYDFLGLKKEDKYYAPSSIISNRTKESNEESLEKLVRKQVVTFPNNIKFSTSYMSNTYTPQEKVAFAKMLVELADRYGSFPVVISELLYSMRKANERFETNLENENFISALLSSIKKGEFLEYSTISDMQQDLKDAYNVSLTSKGNITEELEELKQLRQELLDSKEEIIRLESLKHEIEKQRLEISKQLEELQRLRTLEEEVKGFVKKIGF